MRCATKIIKDLYLSRCRSCPLVAFWSRVLDLIGRIWYVLVLVFVAVQFWWQELVHAVELRREISANKAVFPVSFCLFVLQYGRVAGQKWCCISARLPWRKMDWEGAAASFSNKRLHLGHPVVDLELLWPLPLAGRGGEGRKRCCCASTSTMRWWLTLLLLPRANLATDKFAVAIFDRYGGPKSTSMMEALLPLLWSSTTCCCQVVRPRRWRAGQWQRFFAGFEPPSTLLSDLGAFCTLRLPAICGRDAQGLVCFLFFSSRVFSIIGKAFSSNSRFLEQVMQKGLSVICTCHV